jgi:aspartate racemase
MGSTTYSTHEGAHVVQTIGLIGGMSWESTVPYYRVINMVVKERLEGLHSARIILYSVQHAGDWAAAGQALSAVARSLEAAGADFLVLCTNTMHKVAADIQDSVNIPLLHIADPTAERIKSAGLSRIGLLGTRFTMEQDFYKDRLRDRHGLDVLIPPDADRETVHRIIYEELCLGSVRPESRNEYRRIIAALIEQGAQAVILGCTENSLLVAQGDAGVPLFDTTAIHARAAAELALAETSAQGLRRG